MHLREVVKFLCHHDEYEVSESLLDTFYNYSSMLEQYDELAELYHNSKKYLKAIKLLHICLNMAGNSEQAYKIRSNLAKVYNIANLPEESLKFSNLNLEDQPDNLETIMEISFSYYTMGQKEKSYEIQKNLLKEEKLSDSLKKRIMYNMGTFYMQQGKFKEGIRNMIMGGRGLSIWPHLKKPFKKWDGEFTKNRLLIFGESGIGDEFINIRFVKKLNEMGYNTMYVSLRKDLSEIFNKNNIRSVSSENYLDPTEENIEYVEAMSLPLFLELDKDELWDGSYINPDPVYVEKWKKILPEKFITLRWKGNPYYDQDLHRFIDKDEMVECFKKLNLPIVSLQVDDKSEDSRLIQPDIKSWHDTLAIQYLAAYNITSCTSTAHSASAMGAKTLVLPPIATYYIWLDLRDKYYSRWYGENTTVIAQKDYKSWNDTLVEAFEYVRDRI